MQTLTLARPDDWHLHLRDGTEMASVLAHTARAFARAVVMPNLEPPIATTALAAAYRERILGALPKGSEFEPLMTLYLTDRTGADEIARAKQSGFIHAVKYYPAGATTNSDSGVSAIERAYPAIAAMEKHDLPLLVHGEVVDPSVDVFDRERVFLDTVLSGIVRRFPRLRIVAEHVTTREAVDFVVAGGPNVAATITAHHLLYNRTAMFAGGIRPHYYCLPVLKREEHRRALERARRQGSVVRPRRHLHGARGDRTLRGGIRAGGGTRQARGFRQLPWPGFLPAAAQPGFDHLAKGGLDGAGRDPFRDAESCAAARGRVGRLEARLTRMPEKWHRALDAPMFAALRPLLEGLPPDRFPAFDDLNALATPTVTSGSGAPIRFVPPAAPSREFDSQYEVR